MRHVKQEFFDKQCQKEFDLQHFSQPFPSLLPGMACMPSYMVKHGKKYCLVTDHSSEPFLLNSLINKEDWVVPLCGLQQFRYMLCKAQSENSAPIVIFKSDVSHAYHRVPMLPYWQMLQAVKLSDGCYAINCNNVFSGATSGHCWWSVMALVLWIAKEHFSCTNILDYVNDAYSWEYVNCVQYYPIIKLCLRIKFPYWDALTYLGLCMSFSNSFLLLHYQY